ncbi:site-specific integrase [Burkholderia pseudomallei]|uniref:site-specific integrase n=1 Tax=Burkholderia pseudomallei TaxID=28450 RepID=UPI0027E03BB8|nr:site-specific integrase [Burkholderia pseudomallei]
MQQYMYRRPDSQNWQFRRPVPKHLKASIGKRNITDSLETPDYKAAAKRARELAVETDALFAAHEAKLQAAKATPPTTDAADATPPDAAPNGRPHTLERWMVPSLIERYKAAILDTDEDERPRTLTDLQARRAELGQELQALEDACAIRDTSYAEHNADDMLATEGFDAATVEPGLLQHYTLQLMQADLQAIKSQLERLRGIEVPTPEMPAAPGENDSWDHYLDYWAGQRHPETKTVDEARSQVARLRKYSGDRAPVELTADDIRDYARHLEQNEGVSKSRVKTIFALLRPILQTNLESGLTALRANPFADVKIQVPSKEKIDQQPFEPSHIRLLFKTEVFTAGKRPAKGGGDAAFWLPLLAFFGGEREEELGQLMVCDVQTWNNRMFLRITDLAEEQGVKNRVSKRQVPVHSELMKIGFGRYVERMRAAGHERLFPDLKPNKYGVLTAQFSTWFNEYLDKHVVDDIRYNFHSFRHTFEEFGGRCGLSEYHINGILGHQPEGMAGRYGKKRAGRRVYDPMELAAGMDLFKIEGVDFSHLYNSY